MHWHQSDKTFHHMKLMNIWVSQLTQHDDETDWQSIFIRDYIDKAISIVSHALLRYRGTEHAYDITQTLSDFILMDHNSMQSDPRWLGEGEEVAERPTTTASVLDTVYGWLTGSFMLLSVAQCSACVFAASAATAAVCSLPTMPSPSLSCGSRNYPSTTVKSQIAHSRFPPWPPSLPLAFPLRLRVTRYRDIAVRIATIINMDFLPRYNP